MEVALDWKNLIYLNSQLMGYLVGIVLLFYGYRKNKSNMILGFVFLVFSYLSFIAWLIITGNFIYFPALYRTGNFLALFTIPIIYFYIRSVIDNKPIKIRDLYHFIPALLFLVDYWPVFLMDNTEKLMLIKEEIADPYLFTQFTQSRFFSFNFYTILRTLMLAIYWVFSVKLVWEFNSRLKSGMIDFGRQWLVWIKLFLAFEVLLFLPFYLLSWIDDPLFSFELLHTSLALITLITAVSLFFFPNILYGIDKGKYEISKEKIILERIETLPALKVKEIEAKLDLVLDRDKKYLQRGYTIHSLAADIETPVYLLTFYINHHLKTNFSDLINQKRIEESCQLIASKRFDHFSLVGLAEKSGFNNRNSFTLAFQKFKNVAPSVYIKSLKEKV